MKKVHVGCACCARAKSDCIKGKMRFLYASNVSIENILDAVKHWLSKLFSLLFFFYSPKQVSKELSVDSNLVLLVLFSLLMPLIRKNWWSLMQVRELCNAAVPKGLLRDAILFTASRIVPVLSLSMIDLEMTCDIKCTLKGS